MMASADLELVRSIYAAWECGDFSSVEWAHPEIATPASPRGDTSLVMSAENVELIRRANAAMNAHDVAALVAFLDPAFEFVDHQGAVGEESGSGVEAIRRQLEGWVEVFPDFSAEIDEFIDAGDRVVCVTDWRGTGSKSELNYYVHAAEVFTLRGGKIVRAELGFADKAAALAAAGLAE
jgi:ketosteroid isomerase-like protein